MPRFYGRGIFSLLQAASGEKIGKILFLLSIYTTFAAPVWE